MLDTLQEIRGMLTSQKAQIDSQAQQLKSLTQKVNTNKDVTKAPAVMKRGQVKHSHLTCYKCGGKGHKSNKCPSEIDSRADNSSSGPGQKQGE